MDAVPFQPRLWEGVKQEFSAVQESLFLSREHTGSFYPCIAWYRHGGLPLGKCPGLAFSWLVGQPEQQGLGRQGQATFPCCHPYCRGLGILRSFIPMQYLWTAVEREEQATRVEHSLLVLRAIQPFSVSFICLAYTLRKWTPTSAYLGTSDLASRATSCHHSLGRGSAPVGSQETANLLYLCAATSACPGLPHCLWAAACSLLVWPVSSPNSQLPYHSLFVFFIFWITLFSWVCCLTAWSAFSLSALVIPSINHSTTTSTAINLLPVFQIKIHFSLSYVNTSNKHRLNVFHF